MLPLRLARPGSSSLRRVAVMLASALMLATSLACALASSSESWEAPMAMGSASLDDSSWRPMELESAYSMGAGLDRSMSDRELFAMQLSASGPQPPDPEPLKFGLNLVAFVPCAIYVCRPTPLPNIAVVLNPNTTETLAALGKVDLTLVAKHGLITFSVLDGVTVTGKSVNSENIRLVGTLDAVNGALQSLMFWPEQNFFGYAKIEWTLSSQGSNPVPETKGTIQIVVGTYQILPSLDPLSDDGSLAGFTQNELTTSKPFPGVIINDGAGTSETVYRLEISSFEGKLNLATRDGLTISTDTDSLLVFECLPVKCDAALETFTFTTSAYGAFQGQAGFIIAVTNTFQSTSGFIEGSITNVAVALSSVPGALPPVTVSNIGTNSARCTWRATPAGFVASAATPAPTGYTVQVATSLAGPYTVSYTGAELFATLQGLQAATQYYVQVSMTNAGGASAFSSPQLFTTLPSLPGAVTNIVVTSFTANAIMLTWDAPLNTGGAGVPITMYSITAQPTSLLGTAMELSTVVSYASAASVAGLSGGQEYTIKIVANNAAGASGVATITQATRGPAPMIVSYVASGPASNKHNKYKDGVQLAITFNRNTNQPNAADKTAIDSLFRFTPAIGEAYSGVWTAANVLTITIDKAGKSASPVIGVAYCAVIGDVRSADGNSAASTSTSPNLSGAFGSTGSLTTANVLATKAGWTSDVAMGQEAPLGVGIDLSPLYAEGTYQLVAAVISPLLPGSQLHGTGFSQPGLVITVQGNPAAIQAALNTLMYTPAPGFSGPVSFKFQLINAADGELLASLVTALNVRADRSEPTITAPDVIDVILEQFTATTGISVGSTSRTESASSQFSVSVALSHTGLATFAAPVPNIAYTPAQGTESLTHQLVGTLADLNLALAKLQVKFTFSSNSAQENYAPDPYQLTVEVADMSATGIGASAIRSISANINCNTASVAAAAVSSAQLDATGNHILVTLDKPVSDSYLSSPVFDCAAMLNAPSVALLGESPVCHWMSTVSFRVELGIAANFVPVRDSLVINENALQRCMGGANASPSQTFVVAAPNVALVPSVFISGPKTTSLCNPLVLQGISSMIGGRMPTYTWLLPRNLNPQFAPKDLSNPILEVDPQAFGNGGTFVFSLSVTNFMGQTSVLQSKTVTATNLPVPLIFPTSVTELEQTASESVRIYNSVTTNPCFDEPLKPMIFTWTVTPSINAGASVKLNTANLVIPANVLTPNTVYAATLRVALATNPSELYSEIDYTIHIRANELQAYIAGGEWRKVRADAKEWSLDASRSSDPDAQSVGLAHAAREALGEVVPADATFGAEKYTYTWSCTTAVGAACFSALTGAPLTFTSTPVVTFPANSLKLGLYAFSVTYAHEPTGRASTTSTLISIREGQNPTPYGPSGTVDILLDSVETHINPDGKVHLIATLPAYFTDRRDDLEYTWEIMGGSAAGITTATLLDNPNVQGMGTSHLILNPSLTDSFFVAGTDYHFKVTVHHKDDLAAIPDAGQAMVYVRVNSLPTCDSFAVLPSEGGISFNSTFVVQALNCYDADDSDLLSYTFFRLDDQGNRFNLLPVSHSPLGRIPLVPTGSRSKNFALSIGVSVSDSRGGKQEYLKELKVTPNALIYSDDAKNYINGVSVLRNMYTQTWAPNAAISGDSLMLLTITAAVLTEVNEIATQRMASASPMSRAELVELLELKKMLLSDVSDASAILPSVQVLQTLGELVEDSKNMDLELMASSVDFVSSRATVEGGASTDVELLEKYLQVVKAAIDYIVHTTGAVVVGGGAQRRLFGMESMELSSEIGVASTSAAPASPASIVTAAYRTLDVLALDISTYSLVMEQETFPLALPGSHGFTGAVGRGAAGSRVNISTADGYSVIVSHTAFPDLTAGSFYDVSVFGTSPVPYLGLIAPFEAATIVSGGASVAAFLPSPRSSSSAVSTFKSGDVEVSIPFTASMSSCVAGDFAAPTTDAPASGNVYGNLCKLGCKVWNGVDFSETGATMLAVYPLSKKVVCGLSAPGVAVVYNTVLTTPYVAPIVTPDTTTPLDGGAVSLTQPNGLPAGVVRASLRLVPAPTVFDLNAFKAQFLQDLATVLSIPATRLAVQAVSTTGAATSIIFDILPPTDTSKVSSQQLYNTLAAMSAADLAASTYLKHTELASIMQLCEDSEWRRDCSASTSSSMWSKWELPLIIAIGCLLFICCIGSVIFACIRCRRRQASESMKLAPPMMGTDLVPAKKFVYTAPNSASGLGVDGLPIPGEPRSPGDKLSEVTIMAKGLEFEPSSHSVSGGAEAEAASKNRLSAKFPNKSAAAVAGAGLAGADEAKEDSVKSSHHFYYTADEPSKGAATPSGSRRNSKSGPVFSLNDGNELSRSGVSQSGAGAAAPAGATTPTSELRRKDSSDDLDKAALPVVRPGAGSPKK